MHQETEFVGAPPVVYQAADAESVIVLCEDRNAPTSVYKPLHSGLPKQIFPPLSKTLVAEHDQRMFTSHTSTPQAGIGPTGLDG